MNAATSADTIERSGYGQCLDLAQEGEARSQEKGMCFGKTQAVRKVAGIGV
jgi:hypothetical protein